MLNFIEFLVWKHEKSELWIKHCDVKRSLSNGYVNKLKANFDN